MILHKSGRTHGLTWIVCVVDVCDAHGFLCFVASKDDNHGDDDTICIHCYYYLFANSPANLCRLPSSLSSAQILRQFFVPPLLVLSISVLPSNAISPLFLFSSASIPTNESIFMDFMASARRDNADNEKQMYLSLGPRICESVSGRWCACLQNVWRHIYYCCLLAQFSV